MSGNTGISGKSNEEQKTEYIMPTPKLQYSADGTPSVLRRAVNYRTLRFFQRADVLYQLTKVFCKRFLPQYGDRTVDQMVQAARSCKQNIAEGITDGWSDIGGNRTETIGYSSWF